MYIFLTHGLLASSRPSKDRFSYLLAWFQVPFGEFSHHAPFSVWEHGMLLPKYAHLVDSSSSLIRFLGRSFRVENMSTVDNLPPVNIDGPITSFMDKILCISLLGVNIILELHPSSLFSLSLSLTYVSSRAGGPDWMSEPMTGRF